MHNVPVFAIRHVLMNSVDTAITSGGGGEEEAGSLTHCMSRGWGVGPATWTAACEDEK